MGAEIANWVGAVFVVVYLIVFGIGTTFVIIGFFGSLWRVVSEREKYWQRLREVILITSTFFAIAYGLIVLFWWNRAGLPDVLAYAAGTAFALFVVRKIRSAETPKSANALGIVGAVAAGCIAVYSWGLFSAISSGWSESGYFVASGKCGASFDHCVESGAYTTLADCQRELVSFNGSGDTYECIELHEVPRAYLPWTR